MSSRWMMRCRFLRRVIILELLAEMLPASLLEMLLEMLLALLLELLPALQLIFAATPVLNIYKNFYKYETFKSHFK